MQQNFYRSVKLILQNSTNENLTVQGFALMCGQWDPKATPVQGQIVEDQSAVSWTAQSAELTVGVSGFVRLGGPAGYFSIHFDRPWTGKFTAGVSLEGSDMIWDQSENLTSPDHPSILTVLGLSEIGFGADSIDVTVRTDTTKDVTLTRGASKAK